MNLAKAAHDCRRSIPGNDRSTPDVSIGIMTELPNLDVNTGLIVDVRGPLQFFSGFSYAISLFSSI